MRPFAHDPILAENSGRSALSTTIHPSVDGQYIILTVFGEINRLKAMQQNEKAHELGMKLGIRRYLVDATEARNTDSISDQYNFAYQDMRQNDAIDRNARVALLVAPDDHSHDFIETVSRNSGLNVKLFIDRDAAERFLLDD